MDHICLLVVHLKFLHPHSDALIITVVLYSELCVVVHVPHSNASAELLPRKLINGCEILPNVAMVTAEKSFYKREMVMCRLN